MRELETDVALCKAARRALPRPARPSVRRTCLWLLLLFVLLLLFTLQLCRGVLEMLHTDRGSTGAQQQPAVGVISPPSHTATSVWTAIEESRWHAPLTWQAALELMRQSPVKFVVVDVKNGLGNRLRAMASACAVAGALRRPVLLLWQPDLHCNCSFRQLFEPVNSMTLLEEEIPQVCCVGLTPLHVGPRPATAPEC
jgi:hypothetical protein